MKLRGDGEGSSIKYYPYGETRAGSVPTDKLFTGQRLDSTGLYYYNARYYDPQIGRFISPDVYVQDSTNPQSFNRYSYVLNNPLRYTDPSGNFAFVLILIPLAPVITKALIATVAALTVAAAGYGAWELGQELNNVLFSKKGGKSDKSREDAIKRKAGNIDKHQGKIRENPSSRDKPKWENEIETRREEIHRELERSGPASRQRSEGWLKDRSTTTGEDYGISASSMLPLAIGTATLEELNNSVYPVGTPQYQAQIDQAYSTVASTLGAGQVVSWSSAQGYQAVSSSSYSSYSWSYWWY